MAYKIFVFCALICTIQGINGNSFPYEVLSSDKLDEDTIRVLYSYFDKVQEEALETIKSFERIIDVKSSDPTSQFGQLFDNLLRSFVSITGDIRKNERASGSNHQVVDECILKRKNLYNTFRDEIEARSNDVKEDMQKIVYSTIGPDIDRAKEEYATLVSTISSMKERLPQIKDDREQAVQLVEDTVNIVTVAKYNVGIPLYHATTKFSMLGTSGRILRQPIQKDIKKWMRTFRTGIRECIKAGNSARTA